MNRTLLATIAAAGLMLASAASAQQQQRMPSNPPPAPSTSTTGNPSDNPMTQPRQMDRQTSQEWQKDRAATMGGQRSGTTTQRMGRDQAGERKLDSIASGLNECQLEPQAQRQSCMDQVIRDNGG